MSTFPTNDLLSVKHVTVTTESENGTLKAAVNRYTRPSGKGLDSNEPGLVLFLVHGIGLHKEMWEPTISRLFKLDDENASPIHIQEAWAVDGQNHGESAILNEKIFHEKPFRPIYECAEVFALLYKSHLECFNPKLHKVVMIGHSGGAVIGILSTIYFPGRATTVPYSSMTLIEPAMAAHQMIGKETDVYNMIKDMTPKRRDIWDSPEAAHKWMQKRVPWAGWDPRVLEIYVKHGLRPLPTMLYPDKSGVTLKTTKQAEAQGFGAITNEALDALHRLNQVSSVVPVHLIFGEREELYSEEAQNSLSSPAEKRFIASVTRIPNTGHLIPQEAPDRLAECIYKILTNVNSSSKL